MADGDRLGPLRDQAGIEKSRTTSDCRAAGGAFAPHPLAQCVHRSARTSTRLVATKETRPDLPRLRSGIPVCPQRDPECYRAIREDSSLAFLYRSTFLVSFRLKCPSFMVRNDSLTHAAPALGWRCHTTQRICKGNICHSPPSRLRASWYWPAGSALRSMTVRSAVM